MPMFEIISWEAMIDLFNQHLQKFIHSYDYVLQI